MRQFQSLRESSFPRGPLVADEGSGGRQRCAAHSRTFFCREFGRLPQADRRKKKKNEPRAGADVSRVARSDQEAKAVMTRTAIAARRQLRFRAARRAVRTRTTIGDRQAMKNRMRLRSSTSAGRRRALELNVGRLKSGSGNAQRPTLNVRRPMPETKMPASRSRTISKRSPPGVFGRYRCGPNCSSATRAESSSNGRSRSWMRPVFRNRARKLEWFYRRSGMMMRSPFMLKPGWFKPDLQECLAPNLIAEAARDFGVTDDRVWLALMTATVREGVQTGRLGNGGGDWREGRRSRSRQAARARSFSGNRSAGPQEHRGISRVAGDTAPDLCHRYRNRRSRGLLRICQAATACGYDRRDVG